MESYEKEQILYNEIRNYDEVKLIDINGKEKKDKIEYEFTENFFDLTDGDE